MSKSASPVPTTQMNDITAPNADITSASEEPQNQHLGSSNSNEMPPENQLDESLVDDSINEFVAEQQEDLDMSLTTDENFEEDWEDTDELDTSHQIDNEVNDSEYELNREEFDIEDDETANSMEKVEPTDQQQEPVLATTEDGIVDETTEDEKEATQDATESDETLTPAFTQVDASNPFSEGADKVAEASSPVPSPSPLPEDPLAKIREKTAALGKGIKEKLSLKPFVSSSKAISSPMLSDRLKFNMSFSPSPATPIQKAKDNYSHIPMLLPDSTQFPKKTAEDQWRRSFEPSEEHLKASLAPFESGSESAPSFKIGTSNNTTFSESRATITKISNSLRDLLPTKARIALYFDIPRPKLFELCAACLQNNFSFVLIPSTYKDDDIRTIFEQTSLQAIYFVSSQSERMESILGSMKLPSTLEYVFYDKMDNPSSLVDELRYMSSSELLTHSETISSDQDPISPPADSDSTCILFDKTGGYGAEFTRAQFSFSISSARASLHDLSSSDSLFIGCIDYTLPTFFVYSVAALSAGASLCFLDESASLSPSAATVTETTSSQKPSLVLMDSFLADMAHMVGEQKEIEGGYLRKYIFLRAFEEKKAAQARNIETPFWNFLLIDKTKTLLGGNVRLAICSSRLCAEDKDYLRVILDAQVLSVFGCAAAGGICFTQLYNDFAHQGTVGTVAPGYEVKLVEDSKDSEWKRFKVRGRGVSQKVFALAAGNQMVQKPLQDGWFEEPTQLVQVAEETPIFTLAPPKGSNPLSNQDRKGIRQFVHDVLGNLKLRWKAEEKLRDVAQQ